jgi:uncharacterized protein
MLLLDVNILVYAFHAAVPEHEPWRRWLERQRAEGAALAVCDPVLSGFLRVATLPVWRPAPPISAAIAFVEALLADGRVRRVQPGPGHWRRFTALCQQHGLSGNLVPDAWLAALAIDEGAMLVSVDGDFARFRELRRRDQPVDQ